MCLSDLLCLSGLLETTDQTFYHAYIDIDRCPMNRAPLLKYHGLSHFWIRWVTCAGGSAGNYWVMRWQSAKNWPGKVDVLGCFRTTYLSVLAGMTDLIFRRDLLMKRDNLCCFLLVSLGQSFQWCLAFFQLKYFKGFVCNHRQLKCSSESHAGNVCCIENPVS